MKIRYVLCMLICVCLLGSCRYYLIPHENWLTEDNSGTENALMEQIAECLRKKDAENLKKVFSKQALQEADDINAQVEKLFSFFQGEEISWEEDTIGVSEEVEMGKRKKEIGVWYYVYTEQEEYCIFLSDYPIDEIDEENQGLYAMRVVKLENEKTQMGKWEDMRIPGIYVPDDDTASS